MAGVSDKPRVWNKRDDIIPKGAVYVGRPGKWGNPFVVGKDGTREEVIYLYEQYFNAAFAEHEIQELRGKELVCWCSPFACHGDVLLRLANAD